MQLSFFHSAYVYATTLGGWVVLSSLWVGHSLVGDLPVDVVVELRLPLVVAVGNHPVVVVEVPGTGNFFFLEKKPQPISLA